MNWVYALPKRLQPLLLSNNSNLVEMVLTHSMMSNLSYVHATINRKSLTLLLKLVKHQVRPFQVAQ